MNEWKIKSQTSDADKKSLIALKNCVNQKSYVYLEIGSYLGGTLQIHYTDPRCKTIYSIDKRPQFQPDERNIIFEYKNNSTQRMLNLLNKTYPNVKKEIITFDETTQTINANQIKQQPNLCFIDGEHTNTAVFEDFLFCYSLKPDIIAFHDTPLIFKAIEKAEKSLTVPFQGLKLGGSIYAIIFNKYPQLNQYVINKKQYFTMVRKNWQKIKQAKKTTRSFE